MHVADDVRVPLAPEPGVDADAREAVGGRRELALERLPPQLAVGDDRAPRFELERDHLADGAVLDGLERGGVQPPRGVVLASPEQVGRPQEAPDVLGPSGRVSAETPSTLEVPLRGRVGVGGTLGRSACGGSSSLVPPTLPSPLRREGVLEAPQVDCAFVCPALVNEIVPPHVHWHVSEFSRAAYWPIFTFDEPGDHGLVVTGVQGCGVSTPMAAEVAAATCGLDSDMHMPNVGMLTIGLKSMTVPTSMSPAWTGFGAGVGLNDAGGPCPMVHVIGAPFTTF